LEYIQLQRSGILIEKSYL